MAYAKPDGLNDIPLLQLFLNCVHILFKLGMKYAIQVMRNSYIQKVIIGTGIMSLAVMQMDSTHTFCKFEDIVVFLIAKELLEPTRPIAECLQGRLQEVHFGFKKVDEVKEAYKRIKEDVSTQHNSVYSKALKLADDIGGKLRTCHAY